MVFKWIKNKILNWKSDPPETLPITLHYNVELRSGKIVYTAGSDQPRRGQPGEGVWCWKAETPYDPAQNISEDVYFRMCMYFTHIIEL